MSRPPASAQWLLAALAALAATGAGMALDGRMSVAGLAMVYLLAVALSAAVLDRGPGIAAALLCVTALNFFFVPPRYSFEIDGAEYWWTLAVLLGLALVANTLIGHLRAGRARAELALARAAELHALSEALVRCEGHAAMAACAARWLHEHLHHPCAVFLREGAAAACHGSPEAGVEFHPRSAAWAMEHGRPLGRGCADWPDLPLWCAPFARVHADTGSGGAVQLLLPLPGSRPDAGTAAHWLALARQVGLSVERERAQAAARAASDAARSEAARNTLLASLSHDLRTPLAGIVGSASALRAQGRDMPKAQRARLLANLENEARDLTAMADNVLQVARLSQPQWQLQLQWESLEDVLGAAAARLRRRFPEACIQLRAAPGLPPVRVEAGLLVQAIANLADNALRHAGQDATVTIQAGRSRGGVFVAVRDHGPGLGEADPATLFERYRGGTDSAGRAGGAGLGLAICRLVAEAHGGSIQAQRCEPGAEFRIDLPAPEPQEEAPSHA